MKKWCKFVSKSIKNQVLDSLGSSGGALGAILAFQSNLARENQFFGPPGPPSWVPTWRLKFYFMLKKYLKTPRKDSRRRFERVLKMYMKREVSWDRFFIDFDTILESPGEVKMWFSLRRGSNFEVFASSNISYLLESKKHRFWEVFGSQVGYRKRVTWVQEASWAEVTNFFGVPKWH